MAPPRRRAALTCALIITLGSAGGLSASTALGAPTAAQVRACVEDNLVRYSDPASAVVAQYADIETACRAGLEDGGVVVGFESEDGPATGDGGGTTGPRPADGSRAPSSGATPPGGTATTPPSPVPSPSAPSPSAAPAARHDASVAVAAAIARADAESDSPVPTSLSGAPTWLLGLLAAAGAGLVAAAVVAIRRRSG